MKNILKFLILIWTLVFTIPKAGYSQDSDLKGGLPNATFPCLRADSSTVQNWINYSTSHPHFKRLVLSYYIENRKNPTIRLIASRRLDANNDYDRIRDTLDPIVDCHLMGNAGAVVLVSNQVDIIDLKNKITSLGIALEYLEFEPRIVSHPNEIPNCDCQNFLYYEIWIHTVNKTRSDAGNTNPSPPKPPGT